MNYFFLLLCFSSFALEIQFFGPCQKTPLFKTKVLNKYSQVGELTIDVLQTNNIPYKGTESGLNSIFNTPTGLDALEVISDEEMKAYGWCYKVNSVQPEEFPNEVKITAKTLVITWFYGYAHYLRGNWIKQCAPAYEELPEFLCR